MPSLIDDTTASPRAAAAGAVPALSRRKDVIKGIIAIVMFVIAGFIVYNTFTGGTDPATLSRTRVMIDRDTGEVFEKYIIADGMTSPYPHPSSKKLSLFPAEKCYWTKDGKATTKPTYVLLREYKGEQGETICPDCGRRVVAHNPSPPAKLMSEAAGGSNDK